MMRVREKINHVRIEGSTTTTTRSRGGLGSSSSSSSSSRNDKQQHSIMAKENKDVFLS